MLSPVVVFLGPSLPLAEARATLDAVYLPPAKQADIITAIRTIRPRAIGLVDGEFGQSLSVWHKEILYALDAGVAVFGASSMGALRAAETAAYGMVGVGRVYELYASGALADDDEVALAHGRDDVGYQAFSVPMVNIRATLDRARDEGVIDDAARAQLTGAAKALFFPERTYTRVWREAAAAGAPAGVLAAMRAFVAERAVDVKRDDALALLRTIRDLPDDYAPTRVAFEFNRSHLFETLYNRDRQVRHAGADVPLAAVANYAALHHPDFNALNAHASNRALAGVLAEVLDVEATEADVAEEAARFRLARRLGDDGALAAWMERNDLSGAEFTQLITELAVARILQRWLATRKFMERTTRLVLDELRLRGEYERVAAQAARQEQILAEHYQLFKETSYNELRTRQLVIDHLRATPCRMDAPYQVWADDAGFHTTGDLRIELLRARLAREFVRGVAQSVAEDAPAHAPA